MSDLKVSCEGNVIRAESLRELKIMVAAPGANLQNMEVCVDVGPKDNSEIGGVIILEVSEPHIPEPFKGKADFKVYEKFNVHSRFDLSTLKVVVKNGLVFFSLQVSKDRVAVVNVEEM